MATGTSQPRGGHRRSPSGLKNTVAEESARSASARAPSTHTPSLVTVSACPSSEGGRPSPSRLERGLSPFCEGHGQWVGFAVPFARFQRDRLPTPVAGFFDAPKERHCTFRVAPAGGQLPEQPGVLRRARADRQHAERARARGRDRRSARSSSRSRPNAEPGARRRLCPSPRERVARRRPAACFVDWGDQRGRAPSKTVLPPLRAAGSAPLLRRLRPRRFRLRPGRAPSPRRPAPGSRARTTWCSSIVPTIAPSPRGVMRAARS